MAGTIILLAIGLFCGIMTAFCMKGVDWVLLSGVSISPKEEKQKFKKKHDMIAMNKYIGRRIFLPSSALCFAFAPVILFELSWMQSTWVGVVILIISIVAVVYIGSAVPAILGNKFEK